MVFSNALRFITDPLAHATGNDTQSMADAFGPELAALLVQTPINFATTKLGDNIASALLGVSTLAFASLGARSQQTKHDMLEISAHFFNQALSLRPEDVAEIMSNLQGLRSAIAQGSAQGVRASLVRTPEEITGLIRGIQMQSNALFNTPGNPGSMFIGQALHTPIRPHAAPPPAAAAKAVGTLTQTAPNVPTIIV